MDIFQRLLRENTELNHLREALEQNPAIYDLTGVPDAAKPQLIHGITNDNQMRLVVAPDEEKAKTLYDACKFFDESAVHYPAKDLLFYQSDIHGNTQTAERLRVIKSLQEDSTSCIVVSVDALLNKLAPAQKIFDGILTVAAGDELEQGKFTARLVHIGYESVQDRKSVV